MFSCNKAVLRNHGVRRTGPTDESERGRAVTDLLFGQIRGMWYC